MSSSDIIVLYANAYIIYLLMQIISAKHFGLCLEALVSTSLSDIIVLYADAYIILAFFQEYEK